MGHWPSGAPGTACCTARTTSRVDAVTGGLSSCAPAHQHLDQGADGASPMRHPLLGRERRFGEADAEIIGQEQGVVTRSEEHTSELQSRSDLVCRLLLEK